MEDIKVDEYVRTENGLIFKVDKEKKWLQINEFQNLAGERDIKIHSFDILDLIEKGDFVNGYKVLDLEKKEDRIMICVLKLRSKEHWITLDREDIQDIVTKEQFDREKYVVGE